MKRLLISLILLLSVGSAEAVTYWYSPTGSNANACTAVDGDADPGVYRALDVTGLNCLGAGSTAKLKVGTYNVPALVNALPSGTSDSNRTKVVCETIIFGIADQLCNFRHSSGSTAIRFQISRSWIEINGLDIDLTATSATSSISCVDTGNGTYVGLLFTNGRCWATGRSDAGSAFTFNSTTDQATVSNFDIFGFDAATSTAVHGFYWRGQNGLIDNVRVVGVTGYCIQYYTTVVAISGNTLRNFYCKNSDAADTPNGVLYSSVATNNLAYRVVVIGPSGGVGAGIKVQGGANNKIYHASVYNTAGGLECQGCPASTEFRNSVSLENDTNLTAGAAIVTNVTSSGTAADYWNSPGTGDLTLTSTSPAINTGAAISGFTCNGTCDRGAYESWGTPLTSANGTVNANTMDVTLPMSLNTPFLPASGITQVTVNNGRSVTSATRVGSNIFRIVFDGAACAAESWTFTVGSTTNLTDGALVGNTNQRLHAITGQAVTNNCSAGGTHVITQSNYKIYKPRTFGGQLVQFVNTGEKKRVLVQPNGAVLVVIKLAVTVATAPDFNPAGRYSLNGGSYTVTPDTAGADKIQTLGVGDNSLDIPSEGTDLLALFGEILTSAHSANVACIVVRQEKAIPTLSGMPLNSEAECAYLIKFVGATPGAVYTLRLYNQDGTAFAYAADGTPEIEIASATLGGL